MIGHYEFGDIQAICSPLHYSFSLIIFWITSILALFSQQFIFSKCHSCPANSWHLEEKAGAGSSCYFNHRSCFCGFTCPVKGDRLHSQYCHFPWSHQLKRGFLSTCCFLFLVLVITHELTVTLCFWEKLGSFFGIKIKDIFVAKWPFSTAFQSSAEKSKPKHLSSNLTRFLLPPQNWHLPW